MCLLIPLALHLPLLLLTAILPEVRLRQCATEGVKVTYAAVGHASVAVEAQLKTPLSLQLLPLLCAT